MRNRVYVFGSQMFSLVAANILFIRLSYRTPVNKVGGADVIIVTSMSINILALLNLKNHASISFFLV